MAHTKEYRSTKQFFNAESMNGTPPKNFNTSSAEYILRYTIKTYIKYITCIVLISQRAV